MKSNNLIKGATVNSEVARNISREVLILSTPNRDLAWEEYSGEEPLIYFVGSANNSKGVVVYNIFMFSEEWIEPRLCDGWEDDEEPTAFIKASVKEAGLKLSNKKGYWEIVK